MLVAGNAIVLGGAAQPAPSLEERLPERFTPARPRNEDEEDRLAAAAYFSHGRILLGRSQLHEALRRFERAWRYDPDGVSIVQEIVPLAGTLKRYAEAARYAVLAAERHPQDPELLKQLGAVLIEQNNLPRALALFEKAADLQKDGARDAGTVSLHIEMGRLYYLVGKHEKAAASFALVRDALNDPIPYGLTEEQQKQLVTHPARLYTLMAETFLEVDRFDEAAAMFNKANGEEPNDGLLAFQLARVEAERGRGPAARENLDKYFQAKLPSAGTRPYEVLERLIREAVRDEEKAKTELLGVLQQLLKDDPSNVPLGYFLARKFLDAAQWENAEGLYRDLIQRKPAAEAYRALCEICLVKEDVRELLRVLNEAVEKTGDLEVLADQADRISRDAAWMKKIVDAAREKLQDEPASIGQGGRLAVALLSISAKQFDMAEEFFEASFEAEGLPKQQLMETVGLAMFLAEQPQRAARVFQRLIEEDVSAENVPAYYFYLAGALEMAGQTDEALKAATKSAELKRDAPQFQSRPAWILYHAKRYEEAEKRYLELLELLETNYDLAGAREVVREAKLALSNLCVTQDRMAEAEEWLEQILDEFPEDIGALNDLGYLWADQGKHLNRALAMTSKAVEGDPDNVAYRDSLGWAYYRLGRFDEAVRHLEQAAQGEDPDGIILDHLGDAYLKTNHRDKALATWRRAMKALQNEQEATKYLKTTEEKIKRHSLD